VVVIRSRPTGCWRYLICIKVASVQWGKKQHECEAAKPRDPSAKGIWYAKIGTSIEIKRRNRVTLC
jgi:hypothetical protein